jgi:hypothetical protein
MVSRSEFCWETKWVFLDFAFQAGDALLLGLVGLGDFGEFGFEGCDGGGLGLAGLGLKAGFFRGEVFEHGPEAFGLLAAGFELVGADRAGARTFAAEAGALAVEFAFEFGLPETEFGLEFGVLRGKFVRLLVDDGEAVAEGRGAFVDGGLEFGLLRGGETGDGGFRVGIFLEDEFGLEGLIPAFALFGELIFDVDHLGADFVFFNLESGAGGFDFRRAIRFDNRGDGVPEEQQDQRMSDGDAHQHGHHDAQGKLGEFAEHREVWPVAGDQRAVDRQDDEGPHGGDGINDPRIVGEGGQRVGAGDERKDAGHQHGGPEGHIFPLFPSRALFEGFGAGAGEPEEDALEGGHERRWMVRG